MLIDEAVIFVRSGRGGDGCMSFRREKYVPKGGPDGGNGGRGGDVVLVADAGMNTLQALVPRPHYRARHGGQGMGKSRTGADAADLEVAVPAGTLVFDGETGAALADLAEGGDRFVAVRGGKGGLGNEHFKNATNQAPRESTPGEPYQERTLRLELKLLADVGLVGLPNAGKSTFLRAISRGRPKVADYPFTTLEPHLGMVALPTSRGDGGGAPERRFVVADLPGLIAGAADGAGLGHDFLRHVERTRVLVHVLDAQPPDGSDPIENWKVVRGELAAYGGDLAEKPEVVVLNKVDLADPDALEDVAKRLRRELDPEVDEGPLRMSGLAGEGVREVLESAWRRLVPDASAPAGWSRPDGRD